MAFNVSLIRSLTVLFLLYFFNMVFVSDPPESRTSKLIPGGLKWRVISSLLVSFKEVNVRSDEGLQLITTPSLHNLE